jgi:hypothetical protein
VTEGVEVDQVEAPGHGIDIFEIPLVGAGGGAAGHEADAGPARVSSVVVWIDDAPRSP